MSGEENFYEGASNSSYGISANYGDSFFGPDYRSPSSSFGITTIPNTANVLKDISSKLNTGAKTFEITAIDAGILESIPTQHLEELNRLRKLSGAELTLHGPLIEASGITREGVDEPRRLQAQRQMSLAMEKAHKLDPNGNVIVTFHSTSGLPEMVTRNIVDKDGNKEEVVTEMYAIEERTGQIIPVKPRLNYLEGEKKVSPVAEMNHLNRERWDSQLSNTAFHAHTGKDEVLRLLQPTKEQEKGENKKENITMETYKKFGTKDWNEEMKKLDPAERRYAEQKMLALNHGEIYIRDAYGELQNLFNQAWESAEKNKNQADLKKLEDIRKEIQKAKEGYTKDKANLPQLGESVVRGVQVLSSISVPKTISPLQDFVLDKSSETFSSAALDAYSKFKDKAPIISIENVPIGMGIGRAEDLKKLVDESRKKLTEKLEKSGLSEGEAKEQSKKLIAATWDVGHINMLKQYGYTDKDILKETEKIAPYVNKLHLSDNFGFEHTELPMGMGNVPMKGHLQKLKQQFGDKLDNMKKIIETGNWYQHFQTSPFKKTLEAFGSPIYGMQMSPYWNQTPAMNNNYFAGYGATLPEGHFSMYGAGFSNLPTELGGQTSGRSRLSGAPME